MIKREGILYTGLARRSYVYEPDGLLVMLLVWGSHFAFATALFSLGWVVAGGEPLFPGLAMAFLYLLIAYLPATWIAIAVSRRRAQADRQLFADYVVNNIDQGSAVDYCLYLRPYFMDDKFSWYGELLSSDLIRFSMWLDFEESLAQAIDIVHPVVSVGGAKQGFGPGEISADNERWREAVSLLMEKADLIVVIPFAQPSTLWEVKQIFRKGLLDRTVFILPPMTDPVRLDAAFFDKARTIEEIYARSHQVFGLEGIEFPQMSSKGAAFWYDEAAETWFHHTFERRSQWSPAGLRRIIFEIRQPRPPLPSGREPTPRQRLKLVSSR